jgi:methylmalonyl-CoA/ethylmalonyl-CoA epimerase
LSQPEGEVLLEKIHHLGYAVESVEAASRFYKETFGAEPSATEAVEEQGMVAAMLRLGESTIELMEPTRADSVVARFLARRGEGFHHVAFQVEDLEAALADLKERGVELVDEEPKAGLGGTRRAFVHPRGALGVLTELVELP